MTPEVQELLSALNLLEQGASNQISYADQAMKDYHVKVQEAAALLRDAVRPKPREVGDAGGNSK